MFMQRIRHSTKKNRTILLIVVAALALGIVGAFAHWDSSADYSTGSTGAGESAEMTASQLADQYQSALDASAPASMDGVDYATASTNANKYMTLARYAVDAMNEASSGNNIEGATKYTMMRIDAANKAAEYFQKAIDEAPDTLNKAGIASLLADKGYAKYYAGENDEARAAFEEAYETNPGIAVLEKYSEFLFSVDGYSAAEELLNGFMDAQTDKSGADYTSAKSLLDQWKAMEDYYVSSGIRTPDSSDEDTETTDEDTEASGETDETGETEETTEDGASEETEGTEDAPVDEEAEPVVNE